MARGMFLKRNVFWIAILLLLWNLIGIAAFIAQARMDLTVLAQKDAYQARLFASMPIWAWAAYAVAVFCGFLGSLALLWRSRHALPLYIVSLIGVVVQFSFTFLMTDLLQVRGWSTAIFPAFIALVALFQIWLAFALRRGRYLA